MFLENLWGLVKKNQRQDGGVGTGRLHFGRNHRLEDPRQVGKRDRGGLEANAQNGVAFMRLIMWGTRMP